MLVCPAPCQVPRRTSALPSSATCGILVPTLGGIEHKTHMVPSGSSNRLSSTFTVGIGEVGAADIRLRNGAAALRASRLSPAIVYTPQMLGHLLP
jgi:hypothetical protein